MAKEFYIPVNGFSKKTSKFYAPVNGFSKEIVKAYCSVNGFSKLFYEKGGGTPSDYWEFYETVTKTLWTITNNNQKYNKSNAGIAYFAAIHYQKNSAGQFRTTGLIISTDIDAVTYTITNSPYTYTSKGSITFNGDTWYYAGFDSYMTSWIISVEPDCFLSETEYTSITDATNDLLAKIYSNNFAEDYQIGQTYNLRLGNIEKTIRKAIGVFLFKSVYLKTSTHYNVLLENVDNFVNDLLAYAGDSKAVEFRIFRGYGDIIQLTALYSSDVPDNKNITNKSGAYYYFYYTYNSAIQADKGYRMIQIANDGTITKSGSSSNAGNMSNYIGLYLNKRTISGVTYTTIYLSNIGLNL